VDAGTGSADLVVGPVGGYRVGGRERMADHIDGSGGWRKSTSSGTEDCVEIRFLEGAIQVRNSRDRGGPLLTFGAAEWAAFLAGVRSGDFDR
jgi:hypothetical protein